MAKEYNNSDIYKISYKTKQDFVWFLEALDKINYKEHVKIEIQKLPVPIEILINEFSPKSKMEYRDVLGYERTKEENISLVNLYLKNICRTECKLIITDQYFFKNLDKEYLRTIERIFKGVKCYKIEFIVKNKNINEEAFKKIKVIFDKLKIDLEIKEPPKIIHGRYYITKYKGFSIDNSLNGIFKKESVIQFLSDEDYKHFFEKFS